MAVEGSTWTYGVTSLSYVTYTTITGTFKTTVKHVNPATGELTLESTGQLNYPWVSIPQVFNVVEVDGNLKGGAAPYHTIVNRSITSSVVSSDNVVFFSEHKYPVTTVKSALYGPAESFATFTLRTSRIVDVPNAQYYYLNTFLEQRISDQTGFIYSFSRDTWRLCATCANRENQTTIDLKGYNIKFRDGSVLTGGVQ